MWPSEQSARWQPPLWNPSLTRDRRVQAQMSTAELTNLFSCCPGYRVASRVFDRSQSSSAMADLFSCVGDATGSTVVVVVVFVTVVGLEYAALAKELWVVTGAATLVRSNFRPRHVCCVDVYHVCFVVTRSPSGWRYRLISSHRLF